MAEALALYGYKVVSIEYDRSVLERTRQRLREAGIDNILFVNGDAHKMPFLDNTFDAVVTYNAMHHMNDYKKVLDEMMRVCKNEGKLLITELNQRGKERVAKMHLQKR
ncbi:Methyltransferase domain-containing protein [Caldanaerobius fijiensis DSM 17918]|uniref:Methyltransferase domain-containing protein n=1 Tax=Caldanaerobius fijiensis DSM 17918 TaxID=1121256 RepID=A0A1M5C118_9THEO|nr:Methyltransferase domain-containing protein [Caldanaerobius fijiensis DSM 17918]